MGCAVAIALPTVAGPSCRSSSFASLQQCRLPPTICTHAYTLSSRTSQCAVQCQSIPEHGRLRAPVRSERACSVWGPDAWQAPGRGHCLAHPRQWPEQSSVPADLQDQPLCPGAACMPSSHIGTICSLLVSSSLCTLEWQRADRLTCCSTGMAVHRYRKALSVSGLMSLS